MKKKILLIIIVIIAIAVVGVFSVESYTARSSFCGASCHIMDKPYKTWQGDKHGKSGKVEVRCVDCHYAPGEKMTLHAKFKGLGQLFTYLSTDDKEVRRAVHIADTSCSTAKCHPAEQFMDKKLTYGKEKKVRFTHKAHYEKTIPGQKMHCTTCHIKASDARHFEVPGSQCYICHFRKTDFNKGRAACSLCHEIPTTPLQQQKKDAPPEPGEKIITHQTLEKAGVSCQSCHYQVVRGKFALLPRACETCHTDTAALAQKGDMKLVHTEHVAKQKAKCSDCHQPILHKEGDFIESALLNCDSCHPDHHSYQRALLVGAAYGDVPETPSLMYKVKTNCQGCHKQEEIARGEDILRGSAKACVDCHSKDHDKMLADWVKEVRTEVDFAKETRDKAFAMMNRVKGQLSKDQIAEFEKLFEKGREALDIVEFGNGVHNKKYSIMLIDEAMNSIYAVLDVVEPLAEEQEGKANQGK
jgi:nitrate/TMAO reductase-like tetraheme cytochrome c subunit